MDSVCVCAIASGRHDNEANLAVAAVLRVIEPIQVPLRALCAAESELGGRKGAGRHADDARREQQKVVGLAREKRKIFRLFLIEHRADRRSAGIQNGGVCLDLDRLRDASHFQRNIQTCLLAHPKHDARKGVGLKAIRRGVQPVSPDMNERETVIALAIGRRLLRDAGGDIGQRNMSTRDSGFSTGSRTYPFTAASTALAWPKDAVGYCQQQHE